MYILYKTLKCTQTCCVINVRIITNKDRLRSILRNILCYIHKHLWFMNASERVIGFTIILLVKCVFYVSENDFFSCNKYVSCNIVSTRFLQSHGIERRLYIQVYVKITKLPLFSEKIEKLPLTVYIYGNVYTQYLPSLDLAFCTIVSSVIFFFLLFMFNKNIF